MENKPKFNLFKTMTTVLSAKPSNKPPLEDIKKISPFLFKRWLSNHPNGVFYANLFNLYKNVPIEHQYSFINQNMKGKVKYITLPKKMKDIDEEIKYLMMYFKISNIVAREYHEMMGQERVNEIIYKYTKTGLKG